jgi:hypothetical protein
MGDTLRTSPRIPEVRGFRWANFVDDLASLKRVFWLVVWNHGILWLSIYWE